MHYQFNRKAVKALQIASIFPWLAISYEPNHNQPLDRPFTLLNHAPSNLEMEYHRLIQGDATRSYIFPRPCISGLDSSRVCKDTKAWQFTDSLRNRELGISPVAGYEFRYQNGNAHAVDFGLLTQGNSGPVSFYLDARMFTEAYEDVFHESYDREFVERQDDQASGSIAYTSYSRYRSNLSYDWPWGRMTVARDAAHWGPGLFTNLTFQQGTIPFNQMTFTTHIGPLTVQSLYGQLAASGSWEFDTTSEAKSMYAHRYEWRISPNLLMGISEQLILYKVGAPFAFVPVVPLYITKAAEKERLNNGNIAGDFSYRFPGIGTLYSEFLIDDIQSPTSMFNDAWSNKWAWMAGTHLIRDFGSWRSGLILEYSRIEPWVYTHYIPNTAQTAHQDYPLGNPWGPNSQVFVGKAYFSNPGTWYVSSQFDLAWKGTDAGSSIQDVHSEAGRDDKIFLDGVGSPNFTFRPYAWYGLKKYSVYLQLDIGSRFKLVSGAQFFY